MHVSYLYEYQVQDEVPGATGDIMGEIHQSVGECEEDQEGICTS